MRVTRLPQPETTQTTTGTDGEHPRRGIRRRRLGRRNLLVAGAVAAGALLIGTGFTVQSAVATQERIDATAAITDATGLHADQLAVYSTVAAAKAIGQAEDTISAAHATLAAVDGKVDSSGLVASVASLGEYQTLPIDEVRDLTRQTRAESDKALQAADAYDRAQAEQAAAAAAALAAANTPDGARATAASLAASSYGWGADQFQCLDKLWQKESGWNYQALNSSSGAAGIPQSLPGSKMATAGADWQTNAATQIAWGLGYIARGYGTPCSAWSHSQSMNWY